MSALESNYKILYVTIDGSKCRISKYFQAALYFTNYSSTLNTNTIPLTMFKREFHILNKRYVDFHRYNIYLRIRLNKAMDYFGDQRCLNPYVDISIEFDNLRLNSVLNLRKYYINTQYTKLYTAYIKCIINILHYELLTAHGPNRKTLNAIYKSAELHNDRQILDFWLTIMRNIKLHCN